MRAAPGDHDVDDRVHAGVAREGGAEVALGERDRVRRLTPVENPGDQPLRRRRDSPEPRTARSWTNSLMR